MCVIIHSLCPLRMQAPLYPHSPHRPRHIVGAQQAVPEWTSSGLGTGAGANSTTEPPMLGWALGGAGISGSKESHSIPPDPCSPLTATPSHLDTSPQQQPTSPCPIAIIITSGRRQIQGQIPLQPPQQDFGQVMSPNRHMQVDAQFGGSGGKRCENTGAGCLQHGAWHLVGSRDS